MNKIETVHIEAALYVCIAVFAFFQIQLASDEAGKFIALQALFWLKSINGAALAGATALKTFRSQVFADYRRTKENGNGGNGNGQDPVPPAAATTQAPATEPQKKGLGT